MRISLDFSLDAGQKSSRFSRTLPKKGLEFVLSGRNGTIAFNLSFMLLQAEIDLISKNQGCKKDALRACGISRVKIVLRLLTKIVALYIQAFIIEVGISGF